MNFHPLCCVVWWLQTTILWNIVVDQLIIMFQCSFRSSKNTAHSLFKLVSYATPMSILDVYIIAVELNSIEFIMMCNILNKQLLHVNYYRTANYYSSATKCDTRIYLIDANRSDRVNNYFTWLLQ